MLIGAAVGKLVLEGREIKRRLILIGAAITFPYMIIPTVYGSGMLHIVLAFWAYPHAILFTLGSGLFMFGLFQILKARNVNLSPATVVGRSPLLVYYGHFMLFFILFMLVGFENLSIGTLLGIMVVTVAIVWPLCYVYSRWRWGKPSSW